MFKPIAKITNEDIEREARKGRAFIPCQPEGWGEWVDDEWIPFEPIAKSVKIKDIRHPERIIRKAP